ncbi:hypothetical protein CHS0354_005152 [Potamilus streckersoni]|uniref:Ig-like domain-containing protein n=1 Tax=Potamilus streckersoni TaxID=2493646 RepID=A0AAE0S3Q0_9BIVA|nr:hypothetical protein CHS0354_005152 [Potamilus streckersoni]
MLLCKNNMRNASLYQVNMPWVIFILTVLHTGQISDAQSIYLLTDIALPFKGSSFGMSCILSVPFTGSNGIVLLRNDSYLVSCIASSGCSFIEGYTFKINQTGVFMTILSLDRDSHGGIWTCTYAGNIISNPVNLIVYDLTLATDMTLPFKGSSFAMTCMLSEPFTSNGIALLINGISLVSCLPRGCSYAEGYTVKVNQTGVFMTILSLDRNSHEGIWTCKYAGSITSNAVNLVVYTFPIGISFTQEPSDNVDLSMMTATFQCRTIGCSFPDPVIKWMYENQNFLIGIQTLTSDGCTSTEKIYTSTLFLQRNSTLSDNSDKTVIFSCRINYPNSSVNISTSARKSVRFAVRVTEAVLQQNTKNITDILTVNLGEPVTLTCMTGYVRPDPTINWYIGSQKRGSGPSLNFTPSNADHSEIIYCQAYNTDPNSIAYSSKPRLSVQGMISAAEHKRKSMQRVLQQSTVSNKNEQKSWTPVELTDENIFNTISFKYVEVQRKNYEEHEGIDLMRAKLG